MTEQSFTNRSLQTLARWIDDNRTLIRLGWIGLIGVLIWGSLAPSMAPPGQYQLDKMVHLAAFAGLTCIPAATLRSRRWLVALALGMVAIGVGIEVLQSFVPGREASAADAAADAFGVILGLWTTIPFRRYRDLSGTELRRSARPLRRRD